MVFIHSIYFTSALVATKVWQVWLERISDCRNWTQDLFVKRQLMDQLYIAAMFFQLWLSHQPDASAGIRQPGSATSAASSAPSRRGSRCSSSSTTRSRPLRWPGSTLPVNGSRPPTASRDTRDRKNFSCEKYQLVETFVFVRLAQSSRWDSVNRLKFVKGQKRLSACPPGAN